MRPISIRCSWGVHNSDDVDKHGWPACSRCGTRARIKHKVIRESDRVMTRNKTKLGKQLPVHKQKPFVRSGAKR
jgi:hypothetical protein